jgi:hypothetical protein
MLLSPLSSGAPRTKAEVKIEMSRVRCIASPSRAKPRYGYPAEGKVVVEVIFRRPGGALLLQVSLAGHGGELLTGDAKPR